MTPAAPALLLDVDGVLVVSWSPLPGAAEAVAALRREGVAVRFLTNTTSRTRAQVAEALRGAGIPVDDAEVLTAPVATAAYLRREHPGARCLLLSSGDVADDLEGVHLVPSGTPAGEVDVVVLGGGGPEFTHAALTTVLAALLAGAALVAMHRSAVWRTDRGLELDTGAYLAALELASGTGATVVGKPARALFDAALDSLGHPPSAVMVGDDLDSDVRAAQQLGLTGVLVRTGKFRPEQLSTGPPPDAVLDSVTDLPAWWAERTGPASARGPSDVDLPSKPPTG